MIRKAQALEVNVSRTGRNRFLLQKMDILFKNSDFGDEATYCPRGTLEQPFCQF